MSLAVVIDVGPVSRAKLCDLLEDKDDHECYTTHAAYNHGTDTSCRIEVLDDMGLRNLDNTMET